MITIHSYQIETISWAAERHVRRLKRNQVNNSEQIDQIHGWLASVKERQCFLAYLRLLNTLDLFKNKQFDIDVSLLRQNMYYFELLIEELGRHTQHLDRLVFCDRQERCFFSSKVEYRIEDVESIVKWLGVLKSIDTVVVEVPAKIKVLELLARLPVKTLCVSSYVEKDLVNFIRANQTIESLKVGDGNYHFHVSCDFVKALEENKALKVLFLSIFIVVLIVRL